MLFADIKETKYPLLAICPFRTYGTDDRWLMKAFRLFPSGALKWTFHPVEENGYAKANFYFSYEEAVHTAEIFNASIRQRIDEIDLPDVDRESLLLKAEKEVTALLRRSGEEQLMLQEAMRRHASDTRPHLDDLKIAGSPQKEVQASLYATLKETPYVGLVNLPRFNLVLAKTIDSKWGQIRSNQKTILLCFREKIAKGFGLSATDHWGRTKATIRSMLLPRVGIPRHPATQSTNIRPPIPRSSGRAVGAQRRRFALLV
ncbi:hypothetical protein ACYZT3_21010 [Pseudomonas sp. MDT1-16]